MRSILRDGSNPESFGKLSKTNSNFGLNDHLTKEKTYSLFNQRKDLHADSAVFANSPNT